MDKTAHHPVIARLRAEARAIRAGGDPGALGRSLRRAALDQAWVEARHREIDAAQGFGSYLLFEEDNHDLALFVVSWAPGRGAPPHDHGTWGVVCGMTGHETNTAWIRTADGRLERGVDYVIGPGDLVTVGPRDIHSVTNGTDRPATSLHLYGRHLNHVARNRFDPGDGTVHPFVVSIR
jgi:predicted metal-dependent enzyme (double-stranded beta helix superfamily)